MCMCDKTNQNLSPYIAFILNSPIFKVLWSITDLQKPGQPKKPEPPNLDNCSFPIAKGELMQTHTGLVTWPSKAHSMFKKPEISLIARGNISRNGAYANFAYTHWISYLATKSCLNVKSCQKIKITKYSPKVPPKAEHYIAGYGKYALMSAKGELRNQNTTTLITHPPKAYSMSKEWKPHQ